MHDGCQGEKYKSHGKVIDFKEAHDILKLNVEKIDPSSDLWTDIWELYCRSIAFLQQGTRQGAAKLFESDSVSMTMNVKVQVATQPRRTPRPTGPQVPPSPQPRLPTPSAPARPPKTPKGQAPKKPPPDIPGAEKPLKGK